MQYPLQSLLVIVIVAFIGYIICNVRAKNLARRFAHRYPGCNHHNVEASQEPFTRQLALYRDDLASLMVAERAARDVYDQACRALQETQVEVLNDERFAAQQGFSVA